MGDEFMKFYADEASAWRKRAETAERERDELARAVCVAREEAATLRDERDEARAALAEEHRQHRGRAITAEQHAQFFAENKQLRAEVARLTAWRDKLRERVDTMLATHDAVEKRAETAERELAEARNAAGDWMIVAERNESQRDEARAAKGSAHEALRGAERRELEALAELDEARGDVERFRASMYAVEEQHAAMMRERDDARAEVARLRRVEEAARRYEEAMGFLAWCTACDDAGEEDEDVERAVQAENALRAALKEGRDG